MSRGTRRNDDVLGFDVPAPVVKKPKKLPEDFSFPKGFSIGSGRILMLNKRLLTCYGDIGYHRNCDFEGREPEVDHHGTWRYACSEARAMLIELQALGAETYIPDELESKYVHKPPLLAPFGSLSYLCSSPHYFSPENYPVPTGLPAVDKLGYSHKDRVMLAGSNRYLSMKYRVLAWCLNRIKFYRHQRIRSKLDVSVSLPGNKLEDKIEGCRVLLDEVVSELCKYINLGETTRLFLMPRPLRDNIMEDNGIINLSQLKDISCLYPEGGIPDRSLPCLYLLHESVMGYSLFRFCGVAGDPQSLPLLDYDSFKSYVKLIDHYPFTSLSAQLEHCKYMSKAIVSNELKLFLELNLPPSKPWNWQYMLGVCDPKIAQLIQKKTKIPCITGLLVEDLFRGLHQHIHAFLEIERSQVDQAQRSIGILYSDESYQIERMVHSLDMIDRSIRLLSLNVRKMYSLHFPELDVIVLDNYLYTKLVKCIGNKSQLLQGHTSALSNLIPQLDLLELITTSAKSSIGQDITQSDLDIVCLSANNVLILLESRDKLCAELDKYVKKMAPNLTALVGSVVCARLLCFAGSPMSLVHLLLDMRRDGSSFRDGGIIWNSHFVARATSTESKTKMAKYVAGCCYSAFCQDFFEGASTPARGEFLLGEMEHQLYVFEKEVKEKKRMKEIRERLVREFRKDPSPASSDTGSASSDTGSA